MEKEEKKHSIEHSLMIIRKRLGWIIFFLILLIFVVSDLSNYLS